MRWNDKKGKQFRFALKCSRIIGLIAIIACSLYFTRWLESPVEPQEVEEVNIFQNYQAELAELLRNFQRGSELDASGKYHVMLTLAAANGSVTPRDLTIASQCSVQHFSKVARLAERWQGPMSVTIFAEVQELERVFWGIARLRACWPAVRQNTSFHLVSPLDAAFNRTPSLLPEKDFSCNFSDPNRNQEKNYALRVPYPHNLLRNVARRAIQTEFMMVLDVDLIPSDHLRDMFVAFAIKEKLFDSAKRADKIAYVVPVFEVIDGMKAPSTKMQLLQVYNESLIRPFYFQQCFACQQRTNYEAWKKGPFQQQHLAPLYEVSWRDKYEPFYISRNSAPLFNEQFVQFGYDRASQTCELHMAGYKFFVLDNAFLIHDGFKTRGSFHRSLKSDLRNNRNLYVKFRSELRNSYPNSTRRC